MSNIEYLIQNPFSIRTVVAISYWNRSGSFLLQSMFDNHPEVLSTNGNGVINFFSVYKRIVKDFMTNNVIDASKLISAISQTFPALFEADPRFPHHGCVTGIGAMGANFDKFAWAFLTALNNGIAVDAERSETSAARLIFYSIFIAYAFAQGRELSTRTPIIVWQKHEAPASKEEREELLKILPDVRYLTAVRLVDKGTDAMLYSNYREYKKPLPELWTNLNSLLGWMTTIDRFVPELDHGRYYCVRMEDIHTHPKELMKKLSDWVGISWNDCLLESTIDGQPFVWRRKDNVKQGCNPNIWRDRKCSCLFWYDRLKMHVLFDKSVCAWGYPQMFLQKLARSGLICRLLFKLPFKFELCLLLDEIKQALQRYRESHDPLVKRMLELAAERRTESFEVMRLCKPDDKPLAKP